MITTRQGDTTYTWLGCGPNPERGVLESVETRVMCLGDVRAVAGELLHVTGISNQRRPGDPWFSRRVTWAIVESADYDAAKAFKARLFS